MRKQRLCLVKKNTQKGGGWIRFLKSFQSQQIQTQYKQSKEIEFREFKLGFIVVRHFLTYVHSPQPPNRVRVPLTWSFNQASNLLTLGFRLQWALTQSLQDSNLLKALTLRFLQEMIPQPSLRIAQIQDKARMTHKSALRICKWWFNALWKKWDLLDQEQVGRLLNASVLFSKNEMELSIYKFLSSGVKNSKKVTLSGRAMGRPVH